MFRTIVRLAFLTASIFSLPSYAADNAQIARGEYLVAIAGCNDCHTPGYFFGQPDMDRFLGGSDVGFEIPGLGVFAGRNITPDKETGIGSWTGSRTVQTGGKGVELHVPDPAAGRNRGRCAEIGLPVSDSAITLPSLVIPAQAGTP